MRFRSLLSLTTALVLAGGTTATAQLFDDALRFSENFPLGTARSLGTGNSMAALGADWSAVAANPAGLAAFRRNDFTITLAGIVNGSNGITFDGTPSPGAETRTNFAVPQVGLVLTRKPIGSRWTQFNFGIGVSQSNRFEEQFGFRGESPGSIADVWQETANFFEDEFGEAVFDPLPQEELSAFDSGLAFDAFLLNYIDPNDLLGGYESVYDLTRPDLDAPGPPLTKRGRVSREGRNAAIDLSFGANYDEKVLLGATLGLSRLRYENTFNYSERDEAGLVPGFDELIFNQFSELTGTGIELRLGAIYRASQALRVGLAYHSPRFMTIEDSYLTNLRFIQNGDSQTGDSGTLRPSDASVIRYDFRSPSQYRASVAGLIGKKGFVSGEVTYINFGGSEFGAPDDANEQDEALIDFTNEDIAAGQRGAIQLRLGGEANLAPFKLRAGFQYIGAPIEGEDAVLGFNAGAGFRQNRLGLDLGYQALVRPDRGFTPYAPAIFPFPQSQVGYAPISHTVALTLGWKLVSL